MLAPTRRTALTASVWTVPAITLLSAAPALAASGTPFVTASDVTCTVDSSTQRTISATYTNSNTDPTVSLRVTVVIRATLGSVSSSPSTTSDGWTRTSATTDASGALTEIFIKDEALDYNTSSVLSFTLAVVETAGQLSGTISESPAVTPGTGVAAVGTLQ